MNNPITETLKVQELINLLLAMNPRAEVRWYTSNGEYLPLVADDVQEIYAPEEVAKTVAHIGGPPANAEQPMEGSK